MWFTTIFMLANAFIVLVTALPMPDGTLDPQPEIQTPKSLTRLLVPPTRPLIHPPKWDIDQIKSTHEKITLMLGKADLRHQKEISSE